MILAADIGGASARMATFEVVNGALQVIESHTFESADFEDIGGVLRAFMPKRQSLLAGACFGIAGPVRHGCVRTPNLPWIVDGSVIAHQLGLLEVGLINDLEATPRASVPSAPKAATWSLHRATYSRSNWLVNSLANLVIRATNESYRAQG